ncbi:hypothetical protein ACN20G_33445 (plasmid) [Streptomyces sp. BI20]|uniref:hypothetical protein n=1 Tax=Streptomyces sp. BI20 TaxID=3403460 RepID=UPI003C722666
MSTLSEDIDGALSEVLAVNGRGLLARAVIVAEALDEDGERTLTVVTTPGLPDWDALGFLRYGMLSVEGPAGAYFAGGEE